MLSKQEVGDISREEHERNIARMRRQREELSLRIDSAERTTEIGELKKNLEGQILRNSRQATTISEKNREIYDLTHRITSIQENYRNTDNALRDRIEAAHASTEEVRKEKDKVIKEVCDDLFKLRKRTRQYDTITICSMCSGVMIKIRGKHPQDGDRWACATCTTEKLEQIHESTAHDFNQAYTQKSGSEYGATTKVNRS
jgi:DNA-binding ferritin-like protein